MSLIDRRRLLMVAGVLTAVRGALAQPAGFPSKPVKLLVGFAPGGAVDIIARAIGQQIAPGLGQPVGGREQARRPAPTSRCAH